MRVALWMPVLVVGLGALTGCGRPAEAPAPTATAAPEPVEAVAEVNRALEVEEATIARDEWGVPHIHAKTEVAAAYALGYAMAQDRLEDLCENILIATGRAAAAFGPEFLETDVAMHLVQNDELSRAYFESHENEVTRLSSALMRGVRRYTSENPEALPEWAPELEDHHPMALGRTMILQWPLGTIMDDYGRREGPPEFASNGWAVMPERTAEGVAILCADPHLTWENIQVFYEARFTGGDLVQNGFFLLGVPLLAIGHTAHVAFACTTGGPDTSDVYAMKINEALQYEFEGEWFAPETRLITIAVKNFGEVEIPTMTTRYGFVIPDPRGGNPDVENGVMYVGRSPYFDDMGLVSQMYRMVHAKNAEEFRDALAMNHFMEQNILFADREGTIGYVRTGRVPIRPEGYDWNRPVPGHTAATDWLGIHPIEDLVQIMNPAQGYLQNCNISPQNMMVDSPLTPDKYRDYIYNVSWDFDNPRGMRATTVLDANDTMTVEDAIGLAVDVYDHFAQPWQAALEAAIAAQGAEALAANEALAGACEALLDWDGLYVQPSAGALWMKELRLASRGRVDTVAIAEGRALSSEEQAKLVAVLADLVAARAEDPERLGQTWGDVHFVGRGEQWFPAAGADFGSRGDMTLTETLFNVEYEERPRGSRRWVGKGGSMCTMVMVMRPEGIESYSVVPWGQSGQADSKHYMDQGEHLYTQLEMKRNWFSPSAWRERLDETIVLEVDS